MTLSLVSFQGFSAILGLLKTLDVVRISGTRYYLLLSRLS